jgi:hypothetical protein
VLIVGLLLFLTVHQAMVTTGNPNLVPSLLLGVLPEPATFVIYLDAIRANLVRLRLSGRPRPTGEI